MERASKIARSSFYVFLAHICLIIIGFFFNPIIVRMVGKEGYGSYATLLALLNLGTPLVGLGLFNSIRKHMGQDREMLSSIARLGFLQSLLISVASISIGLSLYTFLERSDFLGQDASLPLLFIVFTIALYPIYDAVLSILYGVHREGTAEFLRVGEKLIGSMLGLTLVYLGIGIGGIFLGIFIGVTCMVIIGFAMARTYIVPTVDANAIGKYRSSILTFGAFTTVNLMLAQALYHSDVLLIRYFLPLEKVGSYKAALVLAEMLWLLPLAFQKVLMHHVSEMWAKSRDSELSGIIHNIAKYVTLALILLGLGLFVAAEPFVKLYFGPEFQDAVLPLRVLLIGSLGYGIARVINPVIEATGYIREGIRISAIIVALNIGLNIIFIPMYGIMGAAIATGISYFAKLIQYAFLLKKLDIRVLQGFQWRRLSVLAVVFLLTLYPFAFLPFNDIQQLVLIPIIGLGLFVLEARALGLMDLAEFKELASTLRSSNA